MFLEREDRDRALCIVTLIVATLIPVYAEASSSPPKIVNYPNGKVVKDAAIKKRIKIARQKLDASIKEVKAAKAAKVAKEAKAAKDKAAFDKIRAKKKQKIAKTQ